MPQPFKLKPGQSMSIGHAAIAARPECATEIAQISAAWCEVEYSLIDMFGITTGTSEPTGSDTWLMRPNKIARATLGAIENLHLRITVVKAATAELLDDDAKKELEALAKLLRLRAGERNTVVHGRWGACDDAYPNDLILIGSDDQTYVRYTPADLKAIVRRVHMASRDVIRFGHKIAAARAGFAWI